MDIKKRLYWYLRDSREMSEGKNKVHPDLRQYYVPYLSYEISMLFSPIVRMKYFLTTGLFERMWYNHLVTYVPPFNKSYECVLYEGRNSRGMEWFTEDEIEVLDTYAKWHRRYGLSMRYGIMRYYYRRKLIDAQKKLYKLRRSIEKERTDDMSERTDDMSKDELVAFARWQVLRWFR